MSFTPAKTSIISESIKTSGGIRKTLLTPCRRLGLSRVVKTPASAEKGGKTTESSSECKTPVNSQADAIKISDIKAKNEESYEVKSEKKVEGGRKGCKKIVKKCLLVDEDFKDAVVDSPKRIVESPLLKSERETSLEIELESENKFRNKVAKESKKSVKKCLLPQEEKNVERRVLSPELFCDNSQISNCSEEKKQNKTIDDDVDITEFKGFRIEPCIERRNSGVEKIQKTAIKPNKNYDVIKNKKDCVLNRKHTDVSDTDDDFQSISKPKKIRRIVSSESDTSIKEMKPILKEANSREKIKSSIKKRLSMKKSKCSSDTSSFKYDSEDEFLPSPNHIPQYAKKSTNITANLTEMPLLVEETETTNQPSSGENVFAEIIVDLTEMPLLFEETPTTRLTPDDDDFVEITEKTLKQVENRVTEKEDKLERLKRAEVYLKKHNINELNDLTSMWKSGCCQALKDLLGLLKSQENVDMVTVLRRLNIPENMIRYNSENGDLL